MTRHTDRLDAHARSLARETGLDYPRIRKIIGRTARDRMGQAIPEDCPVEAEAPEALFWPDLRDGFRYLGPERTLRLFEEVGADQLATRLLVVDHWGRSGPPLFRFPELRDHLAALGAYLQYPHQDILRTGYPSTIFGESAWLRQRLVNLYPVKEPSAAELGPEVAGGRLKIRYIWTRVPWRFVLNGSGPISIYRRGKGITAVDASDYCSYPEAPPLDGLTPERIAAVEALRPKVLGFKKEMLRLLQDGGLTKDRVGTCLDLLSRSFSAEDANTLIQVDRIFSQLEVQDVVAGAEAWSEGAGGITDVLSLVLLVESLERCRAIESVRDLLERHDLISKERFADPRPTFRSYFEVVDQSFEPIVTRAMALFLEASREEAPFLEDALGRIRQAMPTEVAFHWPVWGQDAADFSSLVTEFVRWQQRQKVIAGRYGALDSTGASGRTDGRKPDQEEHANVFRRAPHGTWTFQFAGKAISTDKDPKGLSTIAYLLRNADTDCPVMELAAMSEGAAASQAGPQPKGMNEAALAAEGLSIGSLGDSGDVLDAKARSEYRERRRVILRDLDDAERDGDLARIQRLKGELEALTTELSRAIGLGGRQRKAGDPLERARKTVGKQINVGLEFIQDKHPELYLHLRSRLDYALYVWVYRSAPGITWDT